MVLDFAKLNHVILSVLDNASFALNGVSDDQRIVKIESKEVIKEQRKYAAIYFWNVGSSIPEEHINQIFDPFFTTKAPGEGSGLGLATANAFVHDHDGYMEAANKASGVEIYKYPQ